jgi:hypothetical protein
VGKFLTKRFEFLVIDHIGFARADIRIIQYFEYLMRFGLDPASVFIITPLLGYFADIDLRVEVGGESLSVVAGVAIDDI